MSRDWQHLYSTAIDNPERLQSLPPHLNSSSLNHVFILSCVQRDRLFLGEKVKGERGKGNHATTFSL